MLVQDKRGNELLKIISVDESSVNNYKPLTHSLAIVKIGNDYLMGYNHYRNDWEIFGGCIENDKCIRDCIIREGYEEFGIKSNDYTFIGLMKYKMAPGFFNSEWHEEYGALFGITFDESVFDIINKRRKDKDEIERIELYSKLKSNDEIAIIDKYLLSYY